MSEGLRWVSGDLRPKPDPMAIQAATDGKAKGGAANPQGERPAEGEPGASAEAATPWGEPDLLRLDSRAAPPPNPFETLLRAKAAERGQVLRLRGG